MLRKSIVYIYMSSDNYTYDFYTWHNDTQRALNIADKMIAYSLYCGKKGAIKQAKKNARYAEECPDSESDATVTSDDWYDLQYDTVDINNNNADKMNKKRECGGGVYLFFITDEKRKHIYPINLYKRLAEAESFTVPRRNAVLFNPVHMFFRAIPFIFQKIIALYQ